LATKASQAVDQGLRFRQPKHAGLGIARLRLGCDGADFYKSKTHGTQTVNATCIFVQPSGQADPVGKLQSGQGDGVTDEVLPIGPIQPGVLGLGNGPQGQVMCGFRIHAK
jgi:hypothetical protein